MILSYQNGDRREKVCLTMEAYAKLLFEFGISIRMRMMAQTSIKFSNITSEDENS